MDSDADITLVDFVEQVFLPKYPSVKLTDWQRKLLNEIESQLMDKQVSDLVAPVFQYNKKQSWEMMKKKVITKFGLHPERFMSPILMGVDPAKEGSEQTVEALFKDGELVSLKDIS